jgi:hypothetical protein
MRKIIAATAILTLLSISAHAEGAEDRGTNHRVSGKEKWQKASPEERKEIREKRGDRKDHRRDRKERFKNATSEQKEKMNARREKWQNASPEERKEIRSKRKERRNSREEGATDRHRNGAERYRGKGDGEVSDRRGNRKMLERKSSNKSVNRGGKKRVDQN